MVFCSDVTIVLMMGAIEFARKRSKLIGNKNGGEEGKKERMDREYIFLFPFHRFAAGKRVPSPPPFPVIASYL